MTGDCQSRGLCWLFLNGSVMLLWNSECRHLVAFLMKTLTSCVTVISSDHLGRKGVAVWHCDKCRMHKKSVGEGGLLVVVYFILCYFCWVL